MVTFTDEQMTEMFVRYVDKRSTMTEVAHELGIDLSYISRMYNGERKISNKVLDVLGFQKITVYIIK